MNPEQLATEKLFYEITRLSSVDSFEGSQIRNNSESTFYGVPTTKDEILKKIHLDRGFTHKHLIIISCWPLLYQTLLDQWHSKLSLSHCLLRYRLHLNIDFHKSRKITLESGTGSRFSRRSLFYRKRTERINYFR
jgi:hypothetical protein